MYNIKILPLVFEDLAETRKYLSTFYENTANNFLNDLYTAIENLKTLPYMYEQYEPDEFYRKINVDSYLVFYHIAEDKKTVEVHRVLHGKRNINHFLQNR